MNDRPARAVPQSAVWLAAIFGLVAAMVDMLVGPPQVSATLLVIFAFVLGLTYPRRAWLLALLVGSFVPLLNLVAQELGYGNPARMQSPYLVYLAYVPSFIGAYSAVFLRWYAARQERKSQD